MKHWTKKYWLTLLTVLCALLFAGCSTATTTSQATTQETTVAQNETLDGTWELTDVKTTLRKSFVLRGADPTQYAYAIDDLADWKPQLVISGNEAEFKYSYNFTKYFENLYEHIYKNAFPDKSEYKSVLYEGYAKILRALKVTKIEMDKETNQFVFSLPEGAVDTSNKTITFKETPILLMTFSLGITMQPARPITYQYELDGDTLVVSARGNNERGVFINHENDIQESNRIERSLHMYQSITKKLTLWVAFLSLLLLAGCTGKQEETTVAQSEATTETAKQEVSLDGKWKIYNLRESLESILIYTNPVDQLDGLLIMLIGAEKTTIASEITINGNTAEYHGAYDMNLSFEAYYDTEFKDQNISKEEGLKRYQSYVELLFKKFPDAVGGLSEDKQTLDGTIKNGKVDTQAKTITFTAPIFFSGDIRATTSVLSDKPVTYSYSIENDILTLTLSGNDEIYNLPETIVLQFQKVQE